MASLQEFKNISIDLANLDHIRLIKLLQKHKLWPAVGKVTLPTVLNFIDNITNIPQSQLNTMTFEIKNTVSFIEQQKISLQQKNKLNFKHLKIEKKINDYTYKINQLKNQEVNYKDSITNANSDTEKRKIEIYTQEWAKVQDQIQFLKSEVIKMKKSLLPSNPLSWKIIF